MINTNLSFILRFFSNVPAESQEQVVMHAFSSLPVEVRTALLIKSIDGLQHNEAAEALTEMMAIMTATEAAEPAEEVAAEETNDLAEDVAVKAAEEAANEPAAEADAAAATEEAAAAEAAVKAVDSAADDDNYVWSSADNDEYLGYDPVADLSYAVRRVDTVSICNTRPEVLLDTDRMTYGAATLMFRDMPEYEFVDKLSYDDFMDGCTIENTPAELLGDEVLDLDPDRFPQPKYATNARYFEMMRRVRRLIESHRCMLFEQVSKLSDYAMDDELFEAIKESLRSPYDRSEFLQKTRHQQLHYIASQWADQAKAIKAERRWHESDW